MRLSNPRYEQRIHKGDMGDLIYLVTTAAFLLLMLLLIWGCSRLGDSK